MPRTTMKVTFHYTNGLPYTIKNNLLNTVEFHGEDLGVYLVDVQKKEIYFQFVPKECFAIESSGPHGKTVWENPNYEVSTQISTMTARQRCKRNNILGAYGKLIKDARKFWAKLAESNV